MAQIVLFQIQHHEVTADRKEESCNWLVTRNVLLPKSTPAQKTVMNGTQKTSKRYRCLFCETSSASEPPQEVSILQVDTRVRNCSHVLLDECLLAKLSAGDLIAQDLTELFCYSEGNNSSNPALLQTCHFSSWYYMYRLASYVLFILTEKDVWIETFSKLVESFPLLKLKSSVKPSIM